MSLSRTAGATTAPALLTCAAEPQAIDEIVAALERSIRRPAELVVGVSGADPTAETVAPFVIRAVELGADDPAGASRWWRLARATMADKLVCLGAGLVPGPSLVGAFEHALERVDALVQGPVQVLVDPIEECDPQALRPARPHGARLEVEPVQTHPGALNLACRRRTLLSRICRVDSELEAAADELPARAERTGVPIAWQPAAVAFATRAREQRPADADADAPARA